MSGRPKHIKLKVDEYTGYSEVPTENEINEWTKRSRKEGICGINCFNNPTKQCKKCTNYYCSEHFPSLIELSRPVVDWKMLKIPIYRAEVVSDSTGRPDKKVRNIEIHPIEWDAQIVLSGGRTIATLPIDQVLDVSVVSRPKGIIKKKEDLTVKITFTGNDALEHWIIINIDDRYIKEFLDHIEKLRQKESDETYWTHRSLTFQTGPVGQTRVVDIYPLTPFLAEGENVIWQNMKIDPTAKDKIVEIGLVTNYRVYQYNYDSHTGTSILLPSIEDVAAVKMRTHTFSKKLLGTNSKIIGDIIFTAEGRPFLRFSQVSDPDSLVSLIKSVQEELPNIKVSGGPNMKESDIVINQLADEPIKMQPVTPNKNSSSLPARRTNLQFKGGGPSQIKYQRYVRKIKSINITMGITCRKCDKGSPAGSKFCNNCGSMLSTHCPKCGNSKIPADAIFCNQCGWILAVNESSQDSVQQDEIEVTFLEYILAEYDLKIIYPATWTKQDTNLPELVKIAFFSQREDPSDSYSEHFAVGVMDIPTGMTLEALRDGHLQGLKEANSFLHESVPTTIARIPAWQLVYRSGGFQTLDVLMLRENKAYL